MNNITAVVFDLGRVLVTIDFDAFPNALGLTSPESRAPYRDETALAAHLFETGKLSTREFLDRLYLIFGKRFTREHLLFAWNEIIGRDIPGMVELIGRVETRCRTAMLSNTSLAHFQKAERDCATVRKITQRFLSYEIGTAKPSSAIYRHVIDALNCAPGEILFIDDLKENIDAAIAAGMQGVIFTNVRALHDELLDRHILLPPE